MTVPASGAVDASDWREIGVEVADAQTLLDRGRELLEDMADTPLPTLRWYRSATPAIVLGRSQARLATAAFHGGADPEARRAVSVVTRFSGGGAVLMDDDLLSLDVIVPTGHPLTLGRVSDAFLPVGRAWKEALAELGVTGLTVNPNPSPPRPEAATDSDDARQRVLADLCYATLGRGEVAAGGRKLVGLAQRRRRPGALIQCGLLRRWRPSRLLSALGVDRAPESLMDRAVGLDELVDPPPSDARIMECVKRHLTWRQCAPTG